MIFGESDLFDRHAVRVVQPLSFALLGRREAAAATIDPAAARATARPEWERSTSGRTTTLVWSLADVRGLLRWIFHVLLVLSAVVEESREIGVRVQVAVSHEREDLGAIGGDIE